MHLAIKRRAREVYLDHAATTPTDPEVVRAMKSLWAKNYGNPSSLHSKGVKARAAIDDARAQIGFFLGAGSSEIVFTGSGTESINLALQGVARACKMKGTILVSEIEHHAVLRCAEWLATQGMNLVTLPIDAEGIVRPEVLKKHLTDDTVLVSIMYANNEIGTIQPISELVKVVRAHEKKTERSIVFHTDASAAAEFLDLDVRKLGVDLLSLNGSKIYGPKGIGALYVKRGTRIHPLVFGGGQEMALRSGTENVPGIVGLAAALAKIQRERVRESKRLCVLRDFAFRELLAIPGVVANGSRVNRLPHNVHISFEDLEGESLVIALSDYHIYCSTGSACTSREITPSHVLLALGRMRADNNFPSTRLADGSLRLTLGRSTTRDDLVYVTKVLRLMAERFREVK